MNFSSFDHASSEPIVELSRPRQWGSSSVHPTFAVAIQPQSQWQQNRMEGEDATSSSAQKRRRRRVATASGDKALGVCIWDLDEVLSLPSLSRASSDSSDVAVKLEGGKKQQRLGLLATLPNHLSSVNIVRWEPVIGKRLASGSDLNTQSIIIWAMKEPKGGASTGKDGEESKDGDDAMEEESSKPFGLTRHHSGPPTLTGESTLDEEPDDDLPPNRETWNPILSLHGQSDIQDLAWAPIGLRFRNEHEEAEFGGNAPVGLVMASPEAIARRIVLGEGSQVLASCSLDTSVVVWNTETGDRHTLKGHSGWVIGLAWDPLGSILATQSVDGFVWLWSASSLQLIRKLRSVGLPSPPPRSDVHRTVAMARMSFSPDGAALACCRGEVHGRGKKGGLSSGTTVKHVTVILNRKRNFAAQCVFAGHTDRTTVSACNPVLFRTSSGVANAASSASSQTAFFGIFAMGSLDCNVSIWSTRSPRPLLVLTELFDDAVLDLAWSEDGRTLLASAHDGSIVVVRFTYACFGGQPASEPERQERMKALYGGSGSASAASSTAPLGSLLTSPDQLSMLASVHASQSKLKQLTEAETLRKRKEQEQLARQAAEKQQLQQDDSLDGWGATPKRPQPVLLSPSKHSTSLTPQEIKARQTEVRRADGKRRIVPVAVAAPEPIIPTSHQALGQPVRSSSSSASASAAARVNVAQASEDVLMALTSGADGTEDPNADLFSGTPGAVSAAKAAAEQVAALRQKRLEQEQAREAARAAKKAEQARKAAEGGATDEADQQPSKKQKTGTGTSAVSATGAGGKSGDAQFIVRAPRIKLVLAPPQQRMNRWLLSLAPSAVATAGANEILLPHTSPAATNVRPLSVLKPNQFEFQVCDVLGRPTTGSSTSATGGVTPGTSTILSAFASTPTNAIPQSIGGDLMPPPPTPVPSIPAPTKRQLIWESFLPHRVLMAKSNTSLLAAACIDVGSGMHFLHVLSVTSGRPLHPPMLLSSIPFALTVNNARDRLGTVLVLTCDGLLRVWDFNGQSLDSTTAASSSAAPGPSTGSKLLVQCSVHSMLAAVNAGTKSLPTPSTSASAGGASASATKKPAVGAKPDDPVRIIAARLDANNSPLLVLSNRQSFVYSLALESWQLFPGQSEQSSAYPASEMRSHLQLFERTAAQQKKWEQNESTLAASSAASFTSTPLPPSLSQLAHVEPRTRILQTLGHLEAALTNAAQGADQMQFRQALTSYVAKLVSLYPAYPAALIKLDEVCRELSGPQSASLAASLASVSAPAAATASNSTPMEIDSGLTSASTSSTPAPKPLPTGQLNPFIVGLSKRSLLNSLKPLIQTNSSLLTALPHLLRP